MFWGNYEIQSYTHRQVRNRNHGPRPNLQWGVFTVHVPGRKNWSLLLDRFIVHYRWRAAPCALPIWACCRTCWRNSLTSCLLKNRTKALFRWRRDCWTGNFSKPLSLGLALPLGQLCGGLIVTNSLLTHLPCIRAIVPKIIVIYYVRYKAGEL